MRQMDATMTKGNFFRYYNKLAGCHKYLVFFLYGGNVYMSECDRIAPRWCGEARESHRKNKAGEITGGGEQKWRMNLTRKHKEELLHKGAEIVCSKEEFENIPYSNKGQKCEYWLHEQYDLGTYKPDSLRFDKGGDVVINGIEYQVKFENASLTNVRTLRKAQDDARKNK